MTKPKKTYIQYGCGHLSPEQWENFDAAATVIIQKIPLMEFPLKLITFLFKRHKKNALFPSNVRKGNIVKGLPVKENFCDGLFCSHVLEHLSLNDFRLALRNSYKILKPGGIFRCIVPDLEFAARTYISSLENKDDLASIDFLKNTYLGIEQRKTGIKAFIFGLLGDYSRHLWMWDTRSILVELRDVGFVDIRPCKFGDCEDEMFKYVETESRFENSVAIECRK